MSIKDYFRIFPDYPGITPHSKTNKYTIANSFSDLTWEQIDELIQEYETINLLMPCKNDEFVITIKGWELWLNHKN